MSSILTQAAGPVPTIVIQGYWSGVVDELIPLETHLTAVFSLNSDL